MAAQWLSNTSALSARVSAGAWGDSAAEEQALIESPSEHPFAHDEAQRYARGGLLGEGGMGVVHEVFDNQRQEHIALKTLHRVSAAAISLEKVTTTCISA